MIQEFYTNFNHQRTALHQQGRPEVKFAVSRSPITLSLTCLDIVKKAIYYLKTYEFLHPLHLNRFEFQGEKSLIFPIIYPRMFGGFSELVARSSDPFDAGPRK